jgi:phosphatidylethanolamine-binding protein (PEBP) family uncharacterized protein
LLNRYEYDQITPWLDFNEQPGMISKYYWSLANANTVQFYENTNPSGDPTAPVPQPVAWDPPAPESGTTEPDGHNLIITTVEVEIELPTVTITSSGIQNGDVLGTNNRHFATGDNIFCDGQNISPSLTWTIGSLENVDKFKVILISNLLNNDVDDPITLWDIDLPVSVTSITENFDVVGAGGTVYQNQWDAIGLSEVNRDNGYGGPCPDPIIPNPSDLTLKVQALNSSGAVLAQDQIEFEAFTQ